MTKTIMFMIAMCLVPWRYAAAGDSPTLLHEMFQDHAVLQRDRPIPIWGIAGAAQRVTITINGQQVESRADAAGRWHAQLPSMTAGGPYSLSVRTDTGRTQTVADILIGDVYLCSGQSNMEFPVANSLNATREIDGSADDKIRVLTVTHAVTPAALQHFKTPVVWSAAGPASIRDFSAVCFYFARELRKSLPIPLGLIHASWGGSRIEQWLSESALRSIGDVDASLDLLDVYAHDPNRAKSLLGARWVDWWHSHTSKNSKPWSAAAGPDWRPVPEPMRNWRTWGDPQLTSHDGMVWFRRSVTLTAAQAAQTARISIGAIDKVDETWVNEQLIGNSFGYGAERTYDIPKGVLHAGTNTVVINVLSSWGAGGMYGPSDHLAVTFADAGSASLAGGWRYQVAPDSIGYPPQAPWDSVSGLTGMYNAMIAPMGAYGLRGVLWYQGESNADDAGKYRVALDGLMHDWRTQFASNLNFLIVELPDYGRRASAPAESAWASLREAQRLSVMDSSPAALAVTLDVGEADELHPPNKQAVGRRLARAARRLIYGESITSSGPVAQSARRTSDGIAVTFTDVDGALLAYSAERPIGFELCGSAPGTCRFADALISDNTVVLALPQQPISRVRFCWGDAPICNLYDNSGVPAGPFELPIEENVTMPRHP